MRIKIYQMMESRDKRRLMFRRYAEAVALGGVDPSEYELVFSGNVKAIDLEDIYSIFNSYSRFPRNYCGRSLSVSDVITVGGQAFYCDVIGFEKLESFDAGKAFSKKKKRRFKLWRSRS